MIRIKLALCFFTALILYGCGNKLVELTRDPNCSTTIEGNFIAEPVYKYYSPAIVFPEKSYRQDVLGKVVNSDANGVYVVGKASGILSSNDTLYFNYKDIRAIVDSTRHCIWGKLNDKEKVYTNFVVSLTNLDDEDYSPLSFTWNANSNFSYCARPGHYEITSIIENSPEYSQDITYESVPKRIVQFNVLEGKANYIGDIKLISLDKADTNSLFIPYKKHDSGGNNMIMGEVLFGLPGLAAAAIVHSSINAARDTMNYFVLDISHNPAYQTMSKNPLVKTEIIPLGETR